MFGLTSVAQCRWVTPLGGRQKQKPGLGWCMQSTSQSRAEISDITLLKVASISTLLLTRLCLLNTPQ